MIHTDKIEKQFNIFTRQRIPYWSAFLTALIVGLAFWLVLLYFVMLPTKNTSGEIAVAYYIIIVPEWLKQMSFVGILGLLIVGPIYLISKRRVAGQLFLGSNRLTIESGRIKKEVKFQRIKSVYFNHLSSSLRGYLPAVEVIISLGNSGSVSFIMPNFQDAEDLSIEFFKQDRIKVEFQNGFSLIQDLED